MQIISFNKSGYDPFLDFIKAYAILCVLLGHTFPYLDQTGYSLWYGMQVPLFVLVQVFHAFKKDTYTLSIRKILLRVLIPFIIIETFLFFIDILQYGPTKYVILKYIKYGGAGPGAYYPWIYLQIALVLLFVRSWLKKGTNISTCIVSLFICEVFEILSSLVGFPDYIYRLLAIRYFFLIYLGGRWAKEGIILTPSTVIVSLLSMASIIYFEYFYLPTEPWFYDTAWKTHRWPCYFYVSIWLCSILYWVYKKTNHCETVVRITKKLAKCSYEIFLIQMITIPLMPSMNFINNNVLRYTFRTGLIWSLSIIGGYYFNLYYNKSLREINIFSQWQTTNTQ